MPLPTPANRPNRLIESALGLLPAGRVTAAGWLLFGSAVAAVLLMPPDAVIGARNTDLNGQFLAWRAFAAASLRSGHLPLWNPYTYSGEPFLAGFQSALLYPPNLIFLCLPLCRAVDLVLVAHLFFLGWGMRRLATLRGLHPYAAGLCGLLLPLSGAVFPHLFAGHVPNLCTLAWSPWILAGLEDWIQRRRPQGLLWAAAAICLQITAGHVQYVFYTAIAVGLHTGIRAIWEPATRRRALLVLAAVYAAGAALSAAQLFPGLAAAAESVRGTKVDYAFAAEFSLPPENLLTLFAPGFFGELSPFAYWGRCQLWEMTAFAGVGSLVLAAVAVLDRRWRRAARIDAGGAALLFLLALGWHTPAFRLLYDHVPGFDHFRGFSKFTFPALIYLILAAGRGADSLIRRRLPSPALPVCVLQAGILLGGVGLFLWNHPEAVGGLLFLVATSRESTLPAKAFTDIAVAHQAGLQAGHSLMVSGAVLMAAGASLLGARRRPVLRWIPLLLLPLEMAAFARGHFATTRLEYAAPAALREFVAAHPGDFRVQDLSLPNNGYLIGAGDIWGDDPGLLRRYAEFMTSTQGGNPDLAQQDIAFKDVPPLYALLRFRYLMAISEKRDLTIAELVPHPLAHVQLLSDYQVLGGRDAILAAMKTRGFDPARTVLLESEPEPRPQAGPSAGVAKVESETSDRLTIQADVSKPALLLITDPYSRDWRARPLAGSAQSRYQILPADYILRAIPLAAGHHRILVEYVPSGFRLGIAVSVLAWISWLLTLAWASRQPPRDTR